MNFEEYDLLLVSAEVYLYVRGKAVGIDGGKELDATMVDLKNALEKQLQKLKRII